MGTQRLLLLLLLAGLHAAAAATAQPANFETSLHKRRPGKNFWYGSQMLFATPLSRAQMDKLGFGASPATAVTGEVAGLPAVFVLEATYPNPFNSATTIAYRTAHAGRVELHVVDAAGQPVATGTYLARLRMDGNTQIRKMSLIR
ncbi:MAG: T9SS type A sorting domain-containing protein [Candidatus Latescibacterota bacterium]